MIGMPIIREKFSEANSRYLLLSFVVVVLKKNSRVSSRGSNNNNDPLSCGATGGHPGAVRWRTDHFLRVCVSINCHLVSVLFQFRQFQHDKERSCRRNVDVGVNNRRSNLSWLACRTRRLLFSQYRPSLILKRRLITPISFVEYNVVN